MKQNFAIVAERNGGIASAETTTRLDLKHVLPEAWTSVQLGAFAEDCPLIYALARSSWQSSSRDCRSIVTITISVTKGTSLQRVLGTVRSVNTLAGSTSFAATIAALRPAETAIISSVGMGVRIRGKSPGLVTATTTMTLMMSLSAVTKASRTEKGVVNIFSGRVEPAGWLLRASVDGWRLTPHFTGSLIHLTTDWSRHCLASLYKRPLSPLLLCVQQIPGCTNSKGSYQLQCTTSTSVTKETARRHWQLNTDLLKRCYNRTGMGSRTSVISLSSLHTKPFFSSFADAASFSRLYVAQKPHTP